MTKPRYPFQEEPEGSCYGVGTFVDLVYQIIDYCQITCYNTHMKFSREWLQSYIKEPLPSKEIINDVLSRKAFEVESIENYIYQNDKGEEVKDEIYDIKVLPNRHGDALSHYFMAKELCAVFGLNLISYNTSAAQTHSHGGKHQNAVDSACSVFLTATIDGVDARPSPLWMQRRLESIGQRSINAIVDITNYVQFSVNKPMHAYDAREVTGEFVVRFAKEGEKLMTLNGADLVMDTGTLVIADTGNENLNSKVLGLAGIKGGMYSSIKDDTTSIRLESANFDPILIRKTAKKYNLRTDASKRFEAGQSDALTPMGMELAVSLYKEIFGEKINVSKVLSIPTFNYLLTDSEKDHSILIHNKNIIINKDEINATLGSDYGEALIEKTLNDLDFTFEKNTTPAPAVPQRGGVMQYKIQIPVERVDLKIKEDIIEEIGRVIGYDTLKSTLPKIKDNNKDRKGKYNSRMYLEMELRHALHERVYNEVMTYTLADKGQVNLENSSSAKFLRDNISDGLIKSFYQNINYAPLMQLDVIRSYEIGSIFINFIDKINDKNSLTYDKANFKEIRSLSIICDDNKKKSNFKSEVENLIKDIEKKLFSNIDDKIKINYEVKSEKPYTIEINLNELLKEQIKYTKEEQNKHGGYVDLDIDHKKESRYKHLSPYPIMTRDVSCFYPAHLSIESLLDIIKVETNINQQTLPVGNEERVTPLQIRRRVPKAEGVNENLVKKFYLVDSFEKKSEDGSIKKSAAFRIVYQSDERTLTDEEVNIEVTKVYEALKGVGCEMR